MSINLAALIPCYNHGATTESVVEALEQYSIEIVVINDGSDAKTTQILRSLKTKRGIHLVELPTNSGKGGAVIAGLEYLYEHNFTHAVQVDADGQHDLTQLSNLIASANSNPADVISGKPIYGKDVPKGRLYGRYLTHTCVWLETLSLQIKDSMCGFRVYPLTATHNLLTSQKLGTRMDFDIEILVRLYWQGLNIHYVDTPVHYPENGLSHFHALNDNIKISWLHTRLILGMIPRIPKLLLRSSNNSNNHWSETKERGSVAGIKLMLKTYRLFGRNGFSIALYPIIAYFYCADKRSRNASKKYLENLNKFAHKVEFPTARLSSFQHIYTFGQSILDKLAGWAGDIKFDQLSFHDEGLLSTALSQQRGGVILGSHLGNLELCRALSSKYVNLKINALVFTHHADQFNRVMQQVNPKSNLNLIQVSSLGPDTAMLLEQKLSLGEWVVIVGDRTSVSQHKKVIWQDFLGVQAPFPIGPFVLSSLLKHPVYLMFGFANGKKYDIYFEPFNMTPTLPRHKRQKILDAQVAKYAQRLEHYALRYPLQWFNFFDFWTLENDS